MRVPHEALRDRIQVEDIQGEGAYGPSFSAPRTVRANVQATSQLMEEGAQLQSWVRALVIIRPEDGPVATESRITYLGETYRVERAYPVPDGHHPSHWELQMGRFVQRGT